MGFNLGAAAAAALAAGAVLSLGSPAWANLVVNPNFDLDSPPGDTAPEGWTFTPAASGSDFFVGAGPEYGAYSAPNSANFGATNSSDDELSQVLATAPGETYTISFELAHTDSDSANDFSVQFGGVTGFSLVNADAFGYTLESFTATATSSSTTLAFFGRENPSWYDLDNVSVVTSAVPEPGVWTMLLVGFGLLGAAMRSSARKSAVLKA